jgi:hypothetical protein
MAAPPRDDVGRVIPHDDPDIPGDAWVIRYIIPGWLVPHEDLPDRRRLSSAAFGRSSKRLDHYQSMSVDILQPMLDDGITPADRKGEKYEAIVKLQVADLRGLGLQVGPDPMPDNPYHTGVWRVTGGVGKRLAKLCQWVDKPDDVVD